MNEASPASSPPEDLPVFLQPLLLSRGPTSTMFRMHACTKNLESLCLLWPDPMGIMLHRRYETALLVYLACTTTNQQRNIESSLHLLLSCGACISELCMIAAVMSDGTTERALCKSRIPPKLYNLASTAILEAVLFRAETVDLPCFYGNNGSPAELPCVKLGLCGCFMRPLYAAIYFSNAQMVRTLLRYGAEVRAEDTCPCQGTYSMHPLVRVYRTLAGVYWNPISGTYRRGNISTSLEAVRCHQLAALVMPSQNAELRVACFTFVKASTPSEEYDALLREKRSLQHFCRLTIRAAMTRRRAMPKEVEQLPLPKLLQRYILCQYGPGCV